MLGADYKTATIVIEIALSHEFLSSCRRNPIDASSSHRTRSLQNLATYSD